MNVLVRWTKMPVLLAGSYVILVTAVMLGLIVPGAGTLPGLASPAELGLGSNRVGIEPLTDRFIDRALGPSATSSGQRLDRVGSRGRGAGGRAVDEVLGEVVDHAFTNNDQANAYEVPRLPFTGRTSTAEADREAGEPECGTQLGGTVWYRYTSTRSEALLADTFGTSYQTSLAAYRQTSSGPVSLENACDFDPQGNSQVKIDATSGTTYLFQIGAAVRGGALTFHLMRVGSRILASVSTAGRVGNAASIDPSVSYGGRYVAFASQATNLVPGMAARQCSQVNGGPLKEACYNVFLRDRQAGTTSLVSVGLDGGPANEMSIYPQVSDDGRYVLFNSLASDLVADDTNGVLDAFVRDMRTGRIERVSLSDRGAPVPSSSVRDHHTRYRRSSMSADGRYVAFESTAPNLADGDNDEFLDVFVRDRWEGTTRVVSLDAHGKRSPYGVWLESMSWNGRWIVLGTDVSMSEQDGDLSRDFFVRDLWTGATELISVPEAGHEREGVKDAATGFDISQRSISDDGRFIVFGSDGALVDGDTNNVMDVFVRDRLLKTTQRVSVSSSGGEGTGTVTTDPINSAGAIPGWSIAGDGSTVAFTTDLNGLEPGDHNDWSDVFVHDRIHKVTLRVSSTFDVPGNGDLAGSFSPRISGDGMHTAFYSGFPNSYRDTNRGYDVFVFSPLPAAEEAVASRKASVPTAPCAENSEYITVGLSGAHEDVTPALIPDASLDWTLNDPLGPYYYGEDSVVRFKYRIDLSKSSTNPFAQVADVGVELRWDNATSDYDLYVYDANGELLAGLNGGPGNLNNGDLTRGDIQGIETELLARVPQCMDLRVDVVNYGGLPPREMTLDVTLGGLE